MKTVIPASVAKRSACRDPLGHVSMGPGSHAFHAFARDDIY